MKILLSGGRENFPIPYRLEGETLKFSRAESSSLQLGTPCDQSHTDRDGYQPRDMEHAIAFAKYGFIHFPHLAGHDRPSRTFYRQRAADCYQDNRGGAHLAAAARTGLIIQIAQEIAVRRQDIGCTLSEALFISFH